MTAPARVHHDANTVHLLARLDHLRERVRRAVARRQRVDPRPDDRLRGVYIDDDCARRLFDDHPPLHALDDDLEAALHHIEARAAQDEADGEQLRWRDLTRAFGLSNLDVELLLVALGPDLDPRLEAAYGYLHDDLTRRRASVGLALELSGLELHDVAGRVRFERDQPLVSLGLVHVEEQERPFLTRSLRVPDPVTRYLLGDDGPDPAVAPFVTEAVGTTDVDGSPLTRARQAGIGLVYVRDRIGAAALSFAAHALDDSVPLVLDLSSVTDHDQARLVARAAGRHAALRQSSVVVAGVDELAAIGAGAVRAFTELAVPVVLVGSAAWDPAWASRPALVLDPPSVPSGAAAGHSFRLTPEQAQRASEAAELRARADGRQVTVDDRAAGARLQNASGLERLALRIEPRAGWDDLVLPADALEQLHEIVQRVDHRDQVFDVWGVHRGGAKGRGVTALFAGDSGTGKTLAAEVIARALQLDLYVIDLATVVDKYVGETEKNLDRIFREADRVNGVLLFDEADAIFGKRSEVQDARDRYANVEVAYLLQRMERFDGMALLTTNLRANIDEAFLRRIDAIVDFPMPDAAMRRAIWERHLPPSVPRVNDLDLAFLSDAFALAGGNIKNIATSAAFLAAADGGALTMRSLVKATGREYRKLGRLVLAHEFGPYHHFAT